MSKQKKKKSETRYENLRVWRNALAREHEVRPFRIASNRTLRELAETRPKNEAALRDVPGIGPKTFERFGAAILAALRSA